MQIANTLPELIGNTPLLRLERFAPGAGVLAKLESFNPLSSAKDRAGLYMILDAEERGLLQPGAVIVEPTSGNTGVALAYIGRQRGYRVVLTMPCLLYTSDAGLHRPPAGLPGGAHHAGDHESGAAQPAGRSGGGAGAHRRSPGYGRRH